MVKKILVWTMQRCGGTSFVNNILPSTWLHEPFQPKRELGWITEKHKENESAERINESLNKSLQKYPSIKHCLELKSMPHSLNFKIADEAIRQSFQHLILYRQTSWERLISLYFARKTSAWGPESAKSIKKQNFDPSTIPLNDEEIAELIFHEKKSMERLADISKHLHLSGVEPIILSFEEIYKEKINLDVFSKIKGLITPDNAQHEPTLENFIQLIKERSSRDNQKTSHLYKNIPGVDELIKRSPIHPSPANIFHKN